MFHRNCVNQCRYNNFINFQLKIWSANISTETADINGDDDDGDGDTDHKKSKIDGLSCGKPLTRFRGYKPVFSSPVVLQQLKQERFFGPSNQFKTSV